MATLKENAEIVRTTARGLRAIVEMADQVGDIDKVEAAVAEQKEALKEAGRLTGIAKAETIRIDAINSKVKLDVARIEKDAKQAAAEIVAKAQNDADIIRKQIASDGAAYAANLQAAKAKLAALHKSASDMDVQIADKQTKIAALDAEIKALFARLGG